MAYIGQVPATGDNSFRILDDIKTFTQTFDGSSSSVVSTANATITLTGHRFITGQRVYYSTTGSAIGNLISGTYYYIIKQDQNNIKFALSYANAINNTSIAITGVGSGTNHTLNIAFDGINTKFKATYNGGTKAQINRSAQLQISINGVLQQPQDANPPVDGFSIESDSTIVFSTAPAASDAFWGSVIANSYPTFDVSDNTVDTFTGNGSNTNFSLSKTPANNQNVLVTINGVVQYPSDETNIRSYAVNGNVLTFTDAPAGGSSIQVRHIGFAGATSSNVTGFYGRTGNVVLTTADNINVGSIATVGNINSAGIVTAALLSFGPSNNIEIGSNTTGCSITSGTNNFFAGSAAGRSNTTGSFNNFFGQNAGCSNTTAWANNFLGRYAGCSNTTGEHNNFFGYSAGRNNISGGCNSFFGNSAGQSNTTGSHNFFVGNTAGRLNTTGGYNNFFGQFAGCSNTAGFHNNFLGRYAGRSNTTGCFNNFIGQIAGCSNTTGSYNNFIGENVGRCNTTGCDNNFLGFYAGDRNTTGCFNNFIGNRAGCSNTTGCHNNFLGNAAGFCNTTGISNNFLGSSAGSCNTTGTYNNFFGSFAGRYSTTGNNNNFLGNRAGRGNSTGNYNNFFGRYAGRSNTTGNDNNFLGHCSGLTNTTGSANNFSGISAGHYNTTGCYNNFFGRCAGFCNTTGNDNNFLGRGTGCRNSTGVRNNFIGIVAGQLSTTGNDNNFLGYYAGGKNTTGSNNTFLGRYAGCSNTTGSNNIAIGNNAQLPSATGSCQLAIGSAGVNWIYGDSAGDVGIGTNNPTSKLHVYQSSGDGVIRLTTAYGTGTEYDLTVGGNGNYSPGVFAIRYSTNGTTPFIIEPTGHVTPGADATQNLGSATKRWANIYSADLQLSNEGSSNDVDGTWGKYTIQEGEDDLFLINRRNGKKYKFVLQEVN